MKHLLAAFGVGALVGLSPLAATAQTNGQAQPMQMAQAATGTAHAGGAVPTEGICATARNMHRRGRARGRRASAPDAEGPGSAKELTSLRRADLAATRAARRFTRCRPRSRPRPSRRLRPPMSSS